MRMLVTMSLMVGMVLPRSVALAAPADERLLGEDWRDDRLLVPPYAAPADQAPRRAKPLRTSKTLPYQLLEDLPGTGLAANEPLEPLPEPPADLGPPPQEQPPQPQWNYNGPHAVNADYGSGFCSVRGAHQHPYPPFDEYLFQENQAGYTFLGDPTDFGYAGDDAYWYSGAHPIAVGYGVGWCYIPWPHRHLYAPFSSYFTACGGYYCWGGPFDAWYWYWRPYWAT